MIGSRSSPAVGAALGAANRPSKRRSIGATTSSTADEQDALRRISVMPAAFDLELAAAVLDRTTSATLDTLETLTARSLLHTQRDDSSTQLRYRLLETIRVYAYQRLVDAGDAETTRDRHAHHLADRLEAIGHMPSAMLPAHYPLADDAIAAVEWAHARNDTTLGARLVCGANPIFIGRGLLQKGEDFQDWAALVDDPTLRSKVFICHAVLTLAATSRGDLLPVRRPLLGSRR